MYYAANMYEDKRSRKLSHEFNGKLILTLLSYVLAILLGFSLRVPVPISVNRGVDSSCGSAQMDSSASREYGSGWHSIVFYCTTEYFEEQTRQSEGTSQAHQDVVVSPLFGGKTNGFFLDLAANDAVWISNTYFLEKKFNWTGICMEPNPVYWFGLAHRNCQVVGAVVGEIRKDAVVFQTTSDGALGGIVGDEFENHDDNGGEVRYTVPLQEVLHRFDAPKIIDYLSLDVEGARP